MYMCRKGTYYFLYYMKNLKKTFLFICFIDVIVIILHREITK